MHPIVAGYDGSPASRHALAYAAGMARRADRWLIIVRIWRLGGLASVPLTKAAQAEQMRLLRAELADTDLSDLDIEIVSRIGDPAREIVRATAERRADAVVIGASRGFARLVTVSGRVARHAACPAVVVP
jgi:nucleotide-binding universal stress UspA family protein